MESICGSSVSLLPHTIEGALQSSAMLMRLFNTGKNL